MSRLALAAVVVAGCSSPPPRWHVSDGFLRDPDGRAAILRGVNLSGAQKMAPYLDDKQPADYQRVHDEWGMNAIRFIMPWAAVEPSEGVYDDAYLDTVVERLGWAADASLSVVLDMHQDIYGEGFGFDGAPAWTCDATRYTAFVPQSPWYLDTFDPNVQACFDDLYTLAARTQQFVAAWRHVAQRLAHVPSVVGFDPLNEPAWGTYPILKFEHDRLEPFYTQIVAAVRAEAPEWIAFLEPGASRNAGFATSLTRFGFSDVVYAPHAYDAGAESGSGFDPSHRQDVLDNGTALAGEAAALGAGLWIGEYGGIDTDPGIADYMTAEYDAAGQVAAGTMYWSYDRSDSYGMLAPDGTEKMDLTNLLVRPFPERVAGTPTSYAFDAASATFTFVYAPDRGIAQPTQIAVPPRVYPDGYTVDCGGCASHQDSGELVIDKPPPGATATITIHP